MTLVIGSTKLKFGAYQMMSIFSACAVLLLTSCDNTGQRQTLVSKDRGAAASQDYSLTEEELEAAPFLTENTDTPSLKHARLNFRKGNVVWSDKESPPGCFPAYPYEERRLAITGRTAMLFLIDPSGQVRNSRVEKSSGNANLDRAALEAMRQCPFIPAMKDGVPVLSWTRIHYTFALR
jgi:TonB family protein